MFCISTTCPYCGVGCGIIAHRENDQIKIKGDKNHPANWGRLCSKGAALSETLGLADRLLYPNLNGQSCDWDTTLNKVAGELRGMLNYYRTSFWNILK